MAAPFRDWWPGISEYGSAVPMGSRGKRQAITIRLPFDLYQEVAIRAKARNWSMSDYTAFCVAREVSGKYRPAVPSDKAKNPNGKGAVNQARDMSWVEDEWEPTADDRPR